MVRFKKRKKIKMATDVSKILNTDLLLLSVIDNKSSLEALLKKGYTYSQIYERIVSLQKAGLIVINDNNEYKLSYTGKAILNSTNKKFFIEPDNQYILNTEINEIYIPSKYTVKDLKR